MVTRSGFCPFPSLVFQRLRSDLGVYVIMVWPNLKGRESHSVIRVENELSIKGRLLFLMNEGICLTPSQC